MLGFDFEALAAAVRAARRRLAALDEAVAARALRTGWTGVALLVALGLDGAALGSGRRCRGGCVSAATSRCVRTSMGCWPPSRVGRRRHKWAPGGPPRISASY